MQEQLVDLLRSELAARYVIETELGRGATSVVFLARDLRGDRPVALKVLRPEFLAGLTLKRFQREIELASRLEHPNILRVLEVGDAAGLPYFTMPAVDGGTLQELLAREGPLPFEQVIEVARAIADGLDIAHAGGIVHRDIKPANILFHHGRTVIADFGIARARAEAGSERLTESGVAVGTPPYMSPEQGGNERGIDGRSDVYSLACVVFEMLAGEVPFNGPTVTAILAKHAQVPPPPLSALRPTATVELERVIGRALANRPVDRYASAGAFVDALARANAGITARRRRWNRYLATAAGIALFASLGVWGGIRLAATGDTPADATATARSIAVLYFDDLTPDHRLGHIAAGLTEDLIDRLSAVPALRVISTAGVRIYRDSTVSHDTLAARLGVGTFVTGSAASAGPLLRVTARLIDARTGSQLRTLTLDRPAWDLLTLQDSVTAEVALWLRERLGDHVRGVETRAATRSLAAWEALQRAEARAAAQRRSILVGDRVSAMRLLEQIDSAFEDAGRLDPSWSEPAVRRARIAYSTALVDTAGVARGLYRAIDLASVALGFPDRPAEARAIRGEARFRLVQLGIDVPGDSARIAAVADLRAAASARPDRARTWAALGDALLFGGEFDAAADAFQTAYNADAFLVEMPTVMSGLMFTAVRGERFDDARAWCATGRRRFAGDPRFADCNVIIAGSAGRTGADAADAWNTTLALERADSSDLYAATWIFRRMMIAAVVARAGMPDSARAVVSRAERERGARPRAHPAEAYVQVLLGESGRATEILREFLGKSPALRASIERDPWFRPLQTDPTFRALVSATALNPR